MKIKIEIDDGLAEEEIVIRCKSLSEDVISIQKRITDAVNSRMQLEVTKGEKEYYITIDEILFFETDINGTNFSDVEKADADDAQQDAEQIASAYFFA